MNTFFEKSWVLRNKLSLSPSEDVSIFAEDYYCELVYNSIQIKKDLNFTC